MKTKTTKRPLIILFLLTLLFTFGCKENSVSIETPGLPDNEHKVTIDQGAWGNVHFWEGDFMPMYDPETGGTITPVVRDIYIHEATTDSMVDKVGYTAFYTKINSELIGVVKSDKDGFFQIELEPGKYSFFVQEDSLFYANLWDGEGHILAAEVTKDSVTQVRIDITYKATY